MLSVVCLTLLTSACLSFQYPHRTVSTKFNVWLSSNSSLNTCCFIPQILRHLRAGLFLTHCVEHESRTQVYFSAYKGHKQ